MNAAPSDRAWFSPLLNRIADVAGDRAALLLGREKACQLIYIPQRPAANHWLTKLVGREAALALGREFAGQKLLIPPALAGQKRRRAHAIAEMTDKGYSINSIAASLGVARSTVIDRRRYARREDEDSLF